MMLFLYEDINYVNLGHTDGGNTFWGHQMVLSCSVGPFYELNLRQASALDLGIESGTTEMGQYRYK
jgi:hypothetical protein